MDLTTAFWVGVIGVPAAYVGYRLTRGNPASEPKPSAASFFRSYPRFIDLRNLRGGTLVKHGVTQKQSGKLDVTYKQRFKLKTDYDVPQESVVSYPSGGDYQDGLVVVYPTEELTMRGGKILAHWIKEYQKLDLRLEEFKNAFHTLLEMEANETSTKKAREQMMRLLLDIEEVRKPLKAETDRARQSLEFTQTTPDTKKPEATSGTLGLNR